MSTTVSQYTTTILSCHSLTESMLVHTATVVWLKCSLHLIIYYLCIISHGKSEIASSTIPFWSAKLRFSFEITKNNFVFTYFFFIFFIFAEDYL